MTTTTATLTQTGVVFDWPFHPNRGETVRFFAAVNHFVVTQWGDEFRIRDRRKANRRGGPDDGVRVSRAEADRILATA